MDWILSMATVATNFLVGRKIKWGWIISIFNSFAWMYYAVYVLSPAQFGLLPASVLNLMIAIGSAIKWFKEDK